MRTTIEITEAKLRRLREMAAERGFKGYSAIIDEALEAYLNASPEAAETAKRNRQVAAILATEGSIGTDEAEGIERVVRELRKKWQEPS